VALITPAPIRTTSHSLAIPPIVAVAVAPPGPDGKGSDRDGGVRDRGGRRVRAANLQRLLTREASLFDHGLQTVAAAATTWPGGC
jgi:hypothetical protein